MAAIVLPVATFTGRVILSIAINVFVFVSAIHISEKLKERFSKKNEKQ